MLIKAGGQIAALGYDGRDSDLDGVLNQAEDILFRVRGTQRGGFVSLREVLDEYLEERASLVEAAEDRPAPVASGFDTLDELLGGLHRSDMVILAARPSFGKTSLVLNVAVNVAKMGGTVGVFSLEMGREQFAHRLLTSEAGVDGHRLRLDLLTVSEDHRIMDAIGTLSELPIYIDDRPLLGPLEIRSEVKRLQIEHGLDMVVVDYLRLMEGQGGFRQSFNRVQEISEISRALKGMARDLNVVLLTVSQLSRAVEGRPSHRPLLSDLRESGSIEQDADVVAFIFREDRYFTQEEWDERFPEKPYPKNVAELIVAKHRHGPTGSVNLYFASKFARFESLEATDSAVERQATLLDRER